MKDESLHELRAVRPGSQSWLSLPTKSLSSLQSPLLLSLPGQLTLIGLDTYHPSLPKIQLKVKPLHPVQLKQKLKRNISKGKDVRSRGSFKDPAQAQGRVGNTRTTDENENTCLKVALQKRGWGRLAELGETYYEHLISDDNVNSTSTFTDVMPNCPNCLVQGINQIAEARQAFLGAFHKQGGVQGEYYTGEPLLEFLLSIQPPHQALVAHNYGVKVEPFFEVFSYRVFFLTGTP